MPVITSIAAFLFAITVLVFVHEFGHYKVARLCGIRVLAFSIGFGKKLWSRTDKDGVEWMVCAIPMGGYVRMLDTREGSVKPEEAHLAFDTQHWKKRAAVAAAGPLANLAFAILAWTALFTGGVPEFRPVMGGTYENSQAAKAGARSDDTATAINGRRIETLSDFQMAMVEAAMDRSNAIVTMASPDGSTRDLSLSTDNFPFDGKTDVFRHYGWVAPGPQQPAKILSVRKGSPAEAAGLLSGDTVTSANGRPIRLWSEFVSVVSVSPDKPISIGVLRSDGSQASLSATPKADRVDGRLVGRLGISAAHPSPESLLGDPAVTVIKHPVHIALVKSFHKAWDVTVLSVKSIKSLVTGFLPLDSISGPVGIADQAGRAADAGSVPFLSFMAFISLSLFVMNMLPLPVLDGGHLVFCAYEALSGKPVNEKAQIALTKFGVAALLCLMAVSLWGDISRLIS